MKINEQYYSITISLHHHFIIAYSHHHIIALSHQKNQKNQNLIPLSNSPISIRFLPAT